MPEGLKLPGIPDALAPAWGWFCELSAARSGGGAGPNPLAYSEIKAWAELTRRTLAPRDVEVIVRLDAALLRTWAEHDERRRKALAAARSRKGGS